ncbi:MAG TPA: MIP family channel protein [Methanocorpusculum sp.]|nr:MIP family channel protein [Methanocorpusculum sp.]
MNLFGRCTAEFIGTLVLVFVGCGCAALYGGDLLGIAAAFGLAAAVMIYAVGAVSGAHINPAVSIALCVSRKFPLKDTVVYVIAQMLGAFAGALLIVLIGGAGVIDTGLGATSPAPGTSVWQALAAEFIGTFILMLVIMGAAVDRRAPAGFAGLAIGGTVFAVIMVIGTISGGSLNPARTFGPDLVNLIFTGSDALWTTFPLIYVTGPVLGAAAAAFVYRLIAGKGNN